MGHTSRVLAACVVTFFTGCVNVENSMFHTQYEKTNWYNAGGYDDRMIQSDLYQVWFAANQLVRKENVDYYALIRAAEVTILANKEYFEVISGQDVGQTIRYTIPGYAMSISNVKTTANVSTTANTAVYGSTAYTNATAQGRATGIITTTSIHTPPTENTITFPKTLITIRLVDHKSDTSYSARELLIGAKQKNLKLQVKI